MMIFFKFKLRRVLMFFITSRYVSCWAFHCRAFMDFLLQVGYPGRSNVQSLDPQIFELTHSCFSLKAPSSENERGRWLEVGAAAESRRTGSSNSSSKRMQRHLRKKGPLSSDLNTFTNTVFLISVTYMIAAKRTGAMLKNRTEHLSGLQISTN